MADCNETLRELETFLDGELSDEAQASIHEHLGGCMDCLQAFDFHAELRLVVRQKCSADELPADLVARIERCFDEDCGKFSGREHNLPPTVVEQLKDVAPVGSPTGNSILDILPSSWHDSFPFIR